MNKKIASALIVSLLGTILAGCGGGSGGSSSGSVAPDTSGQNQVSTSIASIILPGPVPADSPPPPTGATYAMSLAIPPRHQWNANYGYCGETAFISAGLYYGQYVSQYTARAAATPGLNQTDVNSQLLISVNDLTAAAAMHLNAVEWNGQANTVTTNQFLAWVKGYVLAGYPVVMGVYVNLYQPGVSSSAGFSAYDHIVPVNGIASNHPLVQGFNQTYYADDILQISDNSGVNNPNYPNQFTAPPVMPAYLFQYSFDKFQMTRVQANAASAPPYSLAVHSNSSNINSAVALTGVIDLNKETVPVRLATDLNYENPAMTNGSNTPPNAAPLTLTATVYGLTPGLKYNVYEYNSLAAIPNSAFNANASAAIQTFTFTATDSTYVLPAIKIMSNQTAAFRAVPASAH
ncbi:C39 family peptidase [Undibacterium sp. TJN19]|uniref:C39 family peptidase n=1 Tax=Undibacterium sp. TJN19 TaxID=3413055 RepID=UPI003BF301A9